jgi:hypothetical protein
MCLRLAWTVVPVLVSMTLSAQDPPAPAAHRLNIIIESEGPINNPMQRTSRETIVQVEDENHKPVAGAAILFLLPSDGSCAFADGSKIATLVADLTGQAKMPRMKANAGQCTVRIHASHEGQEGDTTAQPPSTPPTAPPHTPWYAPPRPGFFGLIVLPLAAITIGLTQLGGGKSTPPPPTPTLTISIGNGPITYGPR